MAKMKRKITIAGKEYVVAYGVQERRDFETAAGMPIYPDGVSSRLLNAQAALIWSAIKKGVKPALLGVDDVVDMLAAHADDGGNLDELRGPVIQVILESGCAGTFTRAFLDKMFPPDQGSPTTPPVPQ